MKRNVLLTIASLLSIPLMTFRRADYGSIYHGGPHGSANKVPQHEALLA